MGEAKIMESISRIWMCSPVKISAYHMCQRWPPLNVTAMKFYAVRILSWFRKSGELRLLRAHHGNAKKCTKVLVEEYGCPHESLSTLTEDMSYKKFIEQWIAERQKIDSQMELLVESIKSMGSSTMSPKEFTSVTTESMAKQEISTNSMDSMNMSINLQSVNQRVMNELTCGSKISLVESDLSMRASDMRTS